MPQSDPEAEGNPSLFHDGFEAFAVQTGYGERLPRARVRRDSGDRSVFVKFQSARPLTEWKTGNKERQIAV